MRHPNLVLRSIALCLLLLTGLRSPAQSGGNTYETVALMAARHDPTLYKDAVALGLHSMGDGLGGHFYSTNSVITTNETTIFRSIKRPTYTLLRIPPTVDYTKADLTNTATGGTTPRLLTDRFSDIKNVLDYGAVGDGTTDDTLAIRAAITAAGVNGVLFFPPGKTFLLSGTLSPLAGQTWSGYGATLKRRNVVSAVTSTAITTSGVQVLTVPTTLGFTVGMDVSVKNGATYEAAWHRVTAVTSTTLTLATAFATAIPSGGTVFTAFPQIFASPAPDKVTVEGFTFEGNKANNTFGNRWELHAEIYLSGNETVIRDCSFRNGPAEGIVLGGINSTIDHCRFTSFNGNAVHFSLAENPTVKDCWIKDCNLTPTVTGHNEGGISWSSTIKYVKISGTHIENCLSGFGNFRSESASHVILTGNTVTNCTYVLEANIPETTVGKVTIDGNHFYKSGMLLLNNNSANPGHAGGPYNFTINNNLFEDSRLRLVKAKGVIFNGNTMTNSTTSELHVYVTDTQDFLASGNILKGGGYGFYVDSAIAENGTNNINISIQNNILRNQWYLSAALFRPGIVNGSIKNNTIVAQTNRVATTWVGIYGNDGAVVEGNQIMAEDGLYGIQTGNGAIGNSKVFRNDVVTRTGMVPIVTFGGSSNVYVGGNFTSAAIADVGTPNNFIGFNTRPGEPLRTGTGVPMGSLEANATNLLSWNRLSFINPADTNPTNNYIYATSNMQFLSMGQFVFNAASGAVTINSIPGYDASYINLYGSATAVNAQIRGSAGSLQMAPANGQYAGVWSYGGTPWFQVGGTLGDTYFKGGGLTADTVPYLNADRRLISSSVTPTQLGYLVGTTSALQTQIDTKAPLVSPSFTTPSLGTATADALRLIDAGSPTATNHFMSAYSGGLHATTRGIFYVDSLSGALQVNSIPGTAASYINMYDSLNSALGQFRGNAGSLQLAPANGQYAGVWSYGGTPWFQVGGTTGDTFFKGASLTADTVPYLDVNRQLKSSAVTPTQLGYVAGATSSLQTQLNSKLSTTNGIAVGLTNTATGGNTPRGLADRLAAIPNVMDYGAHPAASRATNTLAFQAAIDAALTSGVNAIEIEGGPSYHLEPFNPAVAHVLVLAYSSNPTGAGKLSATNPSTPRQDAAGAKYQPFSIIGKGSTGKRPDSTGSNSKGVTLVFHDMDGHIAVETGNFSANVVIENVTLIGSGWAEDSIGIRHNVSASMFDPNNVTIQQFGTGLDMGGDLAAGDTHADFVQGRRLTISECEYGIKINNYNSYLNDFIGFKVEARIPVYNAKASEGVTPSGSVNILGGFYYPAAQYGGILLTGLVTSATANSFTVGSLTKFTKARNGSFVMQLTGVAGSINDVEAGMTVVAEKNHVALGVAQIPWRAVVNEVTSINTGTSTITVSGNVYNSAVVGQPIYIAKAAWAFYGDQFNVQQAHIEEQQADDVGFGAGFLWGEGWRASSVFQGCIINMQGGESGWSGVRPWVYHQPVFAFHPYTIRFSNNRINSLVPKFEVTGTAGVYFDGNQWQTRPLILDHTGQRASGVVRRGDGHFIKGLVPFPRSADAELRDHLHWMGPLEYIQADGLTRLADREVTTLPTTGTTGETFTYIGGAGTTRYRVGSVSGVSGYYSSAALASITGSITSGNNVLTLNGTTGIWDERVISVAGAGPAGADFVARVEGWWVSPDGTSRGAYLHANASTTVASAAISAVAPAFESDLTANSVTIDGGASGVAMETFRRAGVSTNYWSMLGGNLTLHEGVSGRAMLSANHNSATNAMDFHGLVTAPWLNVTNRITVASASTNGAAYFNIDKQVSSSPIGIDEVWAYGADPADGASDVTAISNAASGNTEVIFPAGTWNITTSITFANTVRVRALPGALIKISTGATFTVNGDFDAPNLRIFDVDSGTSAVSFGTRNRVREIPAIWFGATPDNGGTDQTRLTKWVASTTGGKTRLTMTPGIYVMSDTITLPSQVTLEGLGANGQVQINFDPTSDNKYAFYVADNSVDVTILNISFVSANASSGNTVTGTSGIQVGTGTTRTMIQNCRFNHFHGHALDFKDGSLYPFVNNNMFFNINNSAANFGVGTLPGVAIYVQNLTGGAVFQNNKINGADVANVLDGVNAAADEVVGLSWLWNKIENCGQSSLSDTNISVFNNCLDVTWVGNYYEANQTGNGGAAIRFKNPRTVSMSGGVLASDISGVKYSTNMVVFDGGYRAILNGIRFNNIADGGYYISTTGSFASATAVECSFDLGGVGVEATDAEVRARISGNVTLTPRVKGTASQIRAMDSFGVFEEWISSTGTGNVMRASAPVLTLMTRLQRDALTPSNGMVIYQSDSTPGLRFYENGAWVRPTVTADP